MIHSEKKWLTTLLICIFAGGIGDHRFYIGHMKIGVIQLLTFGGLGIWVLIDLIMIALGKFKDSDGGIIKNLSSIEKVEKHSDALMQQQLEIAEKESKPEYRFPKINKNAYDFINPFLRERIITKGFLGVDIDIDNEWVVDKFFNPYLSEGKDLPEQENTLLDALSYHPLEEYEADEIIDMDIGINKFCYDGCLYQFANDNKDDIINLLEMDEDHDDWAEYENKFGFFGEGIYHKDYFDSVLGKDKRLRAEIKKLLIEKSIKITVSDIDAHLQYQNRDEIKQTCEKMYNDGEISFAGNSRYFVLEE